MVRDNVDIKVMALVCVAIVLYVAFKVIMFAICGCLGMCSRRESADDAKKSN